MGTTAASIRRRLVVCAATAALTVSGSAAAAAVVGPNHERSGSGTARPFDGPNFAGIYLSTWGSAHVAFGRAFKSWLDRTGATVTVQAPVALDADHGGFTMPVGPTTDYRLDERGRMAYPGAFTISIPAAAHEHGKRQTRTLRFGPLYIRVVPNVTWSAALSVNGVPTGGEVELATADYPEVLAGGGTPSPSGFRADRVPFHLSPDAAALLAETDDRAAPAAGSMFGMLTPSFDHLPAEG